MRAVRDRPRQGAEGADDALPAPPARRRSARRAVRAPAAAPEPRRARRLGAGQQLPDDGQRQPLAAGRHLRVRARLRRAGREARLRDRQVRRAGKEDPAILIQCRSKDPRPSPQAPLSFGVEAKIRDHLRKLPCLARLNAEQRARGRPPLGFLNPWLYGARARSPAAFVDVVAGDIGSTPEEVRDFSSPKA